MQLQGSPVSEGGAELGYTVCPLSLASWVTLLTLSLLCVFQVLLCLNLKNWEERILQLAQIYLPRECSVMRLLLLRCLMVLCKRPSLVRSSCPATVLPVWVRVTQ